MAAGCSRTACCQRMHFSLILLYPCFLVFLYTIIHRKKTKTKHNPQQLVMFNVFVTNKP